MRILIVERNTRFARYLKGNLISEGFIVDHIINAKSAYLKADSVKYDLIILNSQLEDISGIKLCAKLKNRLDIPVIVISEDKELDTKLKAFKSGADDYLIIPFALEELNARMKVILRRKYTIKEINSVIRISDLKIDLDKRLVKRKSKIINLTKKEYDLLLFMIKNKGKTLSRDVLLENVWERNLDLLPSTVNVHLCNLRNKIDKDFKNKLIQGVHGVGYKFKA